MSKKIWILSGIIFLLAIFFRFYDISLTPPGLYPDEAMNGNNALHAIHTGEWSVFYPENNGREGLFINLQGFFLDFVGIREPWVLRAVAAFFGTATVVGVFFLGLELFNPTIGLLASFFTATSFWAILFSRIGFRANMAPCLAVWAFYLLLRTLKKSNATNTSSFFLAILAGVVFGLGFHSYIAYRVMPALALFVFFYFLTQYWSNAKARSRVFLLFFLFCVSSLIVFAPLGNYFLTHPGSFFGRTSEVSVSTSSHPITDLFSNIIKTIGMFFVRGDGNWRHNFSGSPQLFWPVALCFIVGIFLIIRHKFLFLRELFFSRNISKEKQVFFPRFFGAFSHIESFPYFFLGAWLALAALPVVLSNEGIPHALRSILMIPAVFILAAAGAYQLFIFLRKKISSSILDIIALCVLIVLPAQTYYSYFIAWGQNPNVGPAFAQDYVALGHRLLDLPPELPKYVLVKAGGVLVRGIPMPTQTVMFITDTFDTQQQNEKNIHYVLPDDENKIPPGAYTVVIE